MTMNQLDFYQSLSPFTNFEKAFEAQYYKDVPDNWLVVIADIIDSTKAIESGAYKSVNFVGSLPIIAVINLLAPFDLPYVFGGDGCALLIPEPFKNKVLDVLNATAQFAKNQYELNYRIGAVNMQTIHQHGYTLKLAKFQVSKNYTQAFFTGGGLSFADQIVKQNKAFQFQTSNTIDILPDFSGLECRWRDIPSCRGKTISLLIAAKTNHDEATKNIIYQDFLIALEKIAGNKKSRSAVHPEQLSVTFSPEKLSYEAKALTQNRSFSLKIISMILENLLGKLLMVFSIANWGGYKQNLIATTDSEKFDDVLRMVISVTTEQEKKLVDYLEHEYHAGKLIYGTHSSNRALMTCLIFERHGQQVHFVDAAEGGYALAAKEFKRRQSACD
jgi:Protein of unknown function (DUF3095)